MHSRPANTETAATPIAASLADRPGQRFSQGRREQAVAAVFRDARHPRAVELADAMREIAGCGAGPTENDLSMLGFSAAEIIHHLPQAKIILAESFVRELEPSGDRLPQIIEKALASAVHLMPVTAGLDAPSQDIARIEWQRYCQARAAFKLDPWWSQSERCLEALKAFLRKLPLMDREANRVIYAVAAAQKADVHRGEHI